MRVLGIDPGGSHTGLAIAQTAPTMEGRLLALGGVIMGDGGYHQRVTRRVVPWLHAAGAIGGVDLVVVERAPPTALDDVEHGHQADLGWVLGYLAGLCVAAAAPTSPPIERLPSVWRSSLQVQAARAGLLVELPTRATVTQAQSAADVLEARQRERYRAVKQAIKVDGGYHLVYRCCDGVFVVQGGLAQLQAAAVPPCPACSPRSVGGASEADLVRTAWKALACHVVEHFWPNLYRPLVDDARSRASRFDQPDHLLAGVPDACEAACIAITSLVED